MLFITGPLSTSQSCPIGAILHSPASARKAQEELDQVVGRERLPTFDDVAIRKMYRDIWVDVRAHGCIDADLQLIACEMRGCGVYLGMNTSG